jgi:hypothetical protein
MTDETKFDANPFDNLSSLRLDQSYADTVGVKKLLTTVPERKPNRHPPKTVAKVSLPARIRRRWANRG